ncbi:MAG: LysM peptidoglycan-binding domain-containing protein [Bacillota bacterium]|nr:LysM peptidoglycan-binding domain-containing protein [Bacillota bacterium]
MPLLVLLVSLCLAALAPGRVCAAPGERVAGVAGAAYAVLDVDRGVFLFEHRADEVREPASLTKVMTALVAVEEAPLAKVGRVTAVAAATPGNRVGLVAGERLEMWELLYGALFRSGNDAARALAETVAGSEEAFVARMNAKARSLGLQNTFFQNPHGLPAPRHRSTARELALLGRAALQNPVVAKIVGRTERVLPWGGRGRRLQNINRFLQLYPGATGMKTGYTSSAGYCLMASARRGGRHLLAVVLGSTSSWQRYQDGMRLLDAGFARCQAVAAANCWYVVQPGDTLYDLARRLGLTVEALVKANPGIDPDRIRVGDRLRLPKGNCKEAGNSK